MAELACTTKNKFVGDKPVPKERKERAAIKVHFQKNGDHYIFGEGQKKNYKFTTVMEYQEQYKQDGVYLTVWRDTNTDKLFYSGKNVLNDACTGKEGELVAGSTLKVKASFTFIKVGSATLLTYDKLKSNEVLHNL
jgi:hypothetical protein